VNASGHSDVCVYVTAKPQSLRRRGVQGVTLGHPVGPARAGHLGVEGLLPEGDTLLEGGGAPRRIVLSSKIDHLSRSVRDPSAALRPQDVGGERMQVEYESTFQCRCSKCETCCIINERLRHQGRQSSANM
jgi:hypothetical protein